jgi:hypothetical protein
MLVTGVNEALGRDRRPRAEIVWNRRHRARERDHGATRRGPAPGLRDRGSYARNGVWGTPSASATAAWGTVP